MLIIFFLLTIMLIFSYIVLKIFEPQFKVKKRIDVFIETDRIKIKDEDEKNEPVLKSMFFGLRGKTKDYFSGKISSEKEESIEKKLLQAGTPFGMSPIDFHVIKILLRILLTGLFGIYAKLLGGSTVSIFFLSLLGLLIALLIPGYYLNQKIKQRYKQALRELPDFLDILTVCLEAGLGFDSALNKVISKRNGVLSSEFHICLEEMRLGKTRKEALSGVKDRLESDEIKSLINNVLQAEKLGISVVQIFRIKSQEEREKRRQRAEEEAMKAPIKILFPLVLFIFPSIFIVVLGPAIIQLMTEFTL